MTSLITLTLLILHQIHCESSLNQSKSEKLNLLNEFDAKNLKNKPEDHLLQIFIKFDDDPSENFYSETSEISSEKLEKQAEINEKCKKLKEIKKFDGPSVIILVNHFLQQETIIYKCLDINILGIVMVQSQIFSQIFGDNDILEFVNKNFLTDFKRFQKESFKKGSFDQVASKNKRKTQQFSSFYNYVHSEHNGCVGCAILDYPNFNNMTTYDYDQVFWEFLNWIHYIKYCYWCRFNSICDIDPALSAVLKLLTLSTDYLKGRLCSSFLNPSFFYFHYAGSSCQNDFESLTTKFIDYNLLCLMEHWSVVNSKYSTSYIYNIENFSSNIKNFLLMSFRSGWKGIGTYALYESKHYTNGTIMTFLCEIDEASTFQTINGGGCVNHNSIVLKITSMYINVFPISELVNVIFAYIGYIETIDEVKYPNYNNYFWFWCDPPTAHESVSITTYSDISNGYRFFFDYPKSHSIVNSTELIIDFNSGFFMILLNCQQESCEICESYSKCFQCFFNFYQSDGICYPCPEGCSGCNSAQYCYSCQGGYGRNDSDYLCYPCGENCSYCYNINYCDYCNHRQGRNPDNPRNCLPCLDNNCAYCYWNNICNSCDEGYGVNGTECVNCLDVNCQSCSSNYYYCNYCKKGFTRYYYSNQCFACLSNCDYCYPDLTCYQCSSGYGLDYYTRQCNPCGLNCTYCYYKDYCNSCEPGLCPGGPEGSCGIHPDCSYCSTYYRCGSCLLPNLVPAQNEGCECSQGYFRDFEDSCQPCMSQCLTCLNYSSCVSCIPYYSTYDENLGCVCQPGYFLVSSILDSAGCEQCHPFCLTCSSYNFCLTCKAGSPNSEGVCECNLGYYQVWDYSTLYCYPCHSSCKKCINFYECFECFLEFALPVDNSYYCRCETGYFLDYDPINMIDICSKCPDDCVDCDDLTNCYGCMADHSFITSLSYYNGFSTTCICENGYFGKDWPLINKDSCQICDNICKTCIDQTVCTSCTLNEAILNDLGQCVCPNGFWMNQTYCESCSSFCFNCSSTDFCLSCSDPFAIANVLGECDCIEGYFMNDQNICSACHLDCQNCTNSSSCLTCKDANAKISDGGLFSQGSITFACKCLPGYGIFSIVNGLLCEKCSVDCLECDNFNNCVTCIAENTTIINGQCWCLTGYYNTSALTTLSSCLKCPEECLECDITGKCTICISLNSQISQGSCLCSSGFYNISSLTTVNSCLPCKEECQECFSENNCSICKSLNSQILNGLCVCMKGFYNTSNIISSSSCISCSSECLTCDSTGCLTCLSLNSSVVSGQCQCDSGFFGTLPLTSVNSCFSCHSDCLTCSTQDICLTCKDSNSAPLSSSGCGCNPGYFKDTVQNICLMCHASCSTCNSYSFCLTCVSQNSLITEGSCLCASGFYNVSSLTTSNSCLACREECQECVSDINCLICKSLNSRIFNGLCMCKDGFFNTSNIISSDSCITCSDDCSTCDLNGCLTCISSNASVVLGKCLCDNGYFNVSLLTTSTSCLACHADCLTCNSQDICLTCKDINSYPVLLNGCLCNSKYYKNSTQNLCIACHADCSSCDNSNSCISCLDINAQPSSTSPSVGCECLAGFYLDVSCLACHQNCTKCSSALTCTECKDPNSSPSLSSGCECLPFFFLDITSGNCLQCHQNCSSCNNPLTCISCKDPNSVISAISGCECPSMFFFNSFNGLCEACMQECSSCTSSTFCSSCISLNASPSNTTGCICNDQFFGSGLTNAASCQSCHTECKTCLDANKCLTCKNANTIPSSTVGCDCIIGFFKDSAGICQSCPLGCNACTSLTACLTCTDPNSGPSTTGTCVCNLGYYQATICESCHSDCSSCTSSLECTSCKDPNADFGLFTGCQCKAGYFMSLTRTCDSCSSFCLTCAELGSCLTCKDPNSYPSVSNCPCNQGYYFNSSTNLCEQCQGHCLECSDYSTCTFCKDFNSELVEGKCPCKSQFFFNDTDGLCSNCHTQCQTCSSFPVCLSCMDLNAHPLGSGGCECNMEYFNDTTGICSSCLNECSTCSDIETCLTCKDPNSELTQSNRCTCLEGFFATLSPNFSCKSCDSSCLGCNSKGECLSCQDPNAEPFGLSCSCKQSFYQNLSSSLCEPCKDFCLNCSSFNNCHSCVNPKAFGDECTECHDSCKTCDGLQDFHCTSCDSALQNGFCFKSCALGYFLVEHVCTLIEPGRPVLRYNFEGLGNVFYDSVHDVEARVVLRGDGRSLQNEYGLISSYLRGVYFTGVSSLRVRMENQHLLTSNFSVSVWIKPNSSSGTVLVKYGGVYLEDNENQEIEGFLNSSGNSTFDLGKFYNSSSDLPEIVDISFDELLVIFEVTVGNVTCSVSSLLPLSTENWGHILTKTFYSSEMMLTLTINNILQETKTFAVNPLRDPIFSDMYIAGDASFSRMVVGYFHLLEIYPAKQNLDYINSQVISTSCNGCSVCPITKTCIPNCDPSEFYDSSSKKCGTCPPECPTGCKNENSCNLCVDHLCVGCATFEEKSCTECEVGYQPINWQCEKCGIYTFFDMNSKRCVFCSGLCKTCKSESICITCKDRSSLNEDKKCECDFGYEGENFCIRKTFFTSFWLNQENIANFEFSKKLMKNLDDSYLKVMIDGKKVEFQAETSDFKYFQVFLESGKIKNKSILEILVIRDVVAFDNALLVNRTFQAELTLTEALAAAQELAVKAAVAKDTAKTGATAGVSLAVGISLFNFDPSSFFDFLNTAEMFYAVYLDNFELNPILAEFLIGLRIQESIPNLFNYIMGDHHGNPVSKKLNKFGYKSNLALMNIGVHIEMLALFLVLALLIYFLSKNDWLGQKLKGIRKGFKFGVFLRFWLQSYFEILIACSLGLRTNTFDNGIQIFDYCCCILFLVSFTKLIEVCGVAFFLYLLRKRSHLVEEQEIKEFIKKFGTFFEEFKEDSLGYWYFYLFYILRRTLIVVCYQLVSDGIQQLSVSIVFSLSVLSKQIPIYIAFTRCFKISIYNVFHFFNEIIIGIYHCSILVSFIRGEVEDSQKLSNLCLQLIFTAWAMNIGVSLFNTSKNVVDRIKKCREKRRKKIAKVYRLDKTTDVTTIQNNKTINETIDMNNA